MNVLSKLFTAILLCSLALGTLWAAPPGPNYVVNTATEGTFAENEAAKILNRVSALPTVPHLNSGAMLAAMKNTAYQIGGATPFTFVIAHRGSHTAPGCPENSACSIAAAYNAGADAIELDIKITADNGPVLGHDNAIARELDDWIDSKGQSQKRNANWTPFKNFPINDPIYQDLTNYPFLYNFKSNLDPNNPPRNQMKVAQLQGSAMIDTYDQSTYYDQLTLYEALYIINKYYPMAIWLDVKNATDLVPVAQSLQAARTTFGNTAALQNVYFKLGYSAVSDPEVNGNPGNYMGSHLSPAVASMPGINYFLVFGTGDLDTMAGAATSSTASAQAYAKLKSYCAPGNTNGCLGAEVSHKYDGAPTDGIYSLCATNKDCGQLAGFQTVPQYSWYWQTLPQNQQAATYGRTFPRTDGSCCFALTDTLNVSQYLGPETEDLRPLYSWNESTFSTITTDEPLITLRNLYRKGKRAIGTAQAIGGLNTQIASGGVPASIAPLNGLYYLKNVFGDYLTVDSSGAPITVADPSSIDTSMMWYVSSIDGVSMVSITNAKWGGSIFVDPEGNFKLDYVSPDPGFQWGLSMAEQGGGYILQTFNISTSTIYAMTQTVNETNQKVFAVANPGFINSWNAVPVSTPSSEVAQQQAGPPGYTYCSDELGTGICNFYDQASVAYGANGKFRYLQYVTGPVACTSASFKNIDPAPGVRKACFYAPYSGEELSPSFDGNQYTEGSALFLGTTNQIVAFGLMDWSKDAALFTYRTLSGNATCNVSTFGIDPAKGVAKMCYTVLDPTSLPTGPVGFTFCARVGENCAFSGTAIVAHGHDGRYTYKTLTNGAHCGSDTFGFDPFLDVVKGCFYKPLTPKGFTTSPELPLAGTTADPYYFYYCASEHNPCTNISLNGMLAYGETDSYVFKTITEMYPNLVASDTPSPNCDNGTFGLDPVPFASKSCHWIKLTPADQGPPGFSYCGSENSICPFIGVAEVAFGINGRYVYNPKITAADGDPMDCNLDFFPGQADPYPGLAKACYYRLYQ